MICIIWHSRSWRKPKHGNQEIISHPNYITDLGTQTNHGGRMACDSCCCWILLQRLHHRLPTLPHIIRGKGIQLNINPSSAPLEASFSVPWEPWNVPQAYLRCLHIFSYLQHMTSDHIIHSICWKPFLKHLNQIFVL